MSTWTVRLRELGLTLPAVAAATAGSAPAVLSGGHVHTAGQFPLVRGVLPVTGSVGAEVGVEQGADLARTAALNALAAIDAVAGIDSVVRIVRLVGYVASAPGFTGQAAVLDGASELLHQVFGERGAPARTAVGVLALPYGSPVELELLAAVAPDERPARTRTRAERAVVGDGRAVTLGLRRPGPSPTTATLAGDRGPEVRTGPGREPAGLRTLHCARPGTASPAGPWAAWEAAFAARRVPEPARTAGPVELTTAVAGLGDEVDPAEVVRIATAAFQVDRLEGCRDALARVARDGGAVAPAIRATTLLALDDIRTGRWDSADRLLAEASGRCETRGHQLLAVPTRYGQALLAALRGDAAAARAHTDTMTGWAVPRGVRVALAYAGHVRTVLALGQGDHEQAYQQATALAGAGEPARWVSMDLVEAAVHTRRTAEATAHVAALHRAGVADLSPRLALLAAGATALAAPDDAAPDAFEAALAVPGAGRWTFDLARVRLAYGERLRRTGSCTGARVQLAAALETFDRLGAAPWSARAGAELRATGRTRSRPGRLGPAGLTPQEYEIAQHAAAGLTNKEIAARLYLSHRTVGSHLHHAFPKLGVTSRAALRDALTRTPAPDR